MNSLQTVPEWFGGATLAALIAALGYLFRLVVDAVGKARARAEERQARLAELRSILHAGRETFRVQAANRNALTRMIEARQSKPRPPVAGPQTRSPIEGFEDILASDYPNMESDERELHGIIRGMTIHALRPLNESLHEWLKADRYFKALPVSQELQQWISKLHPGEVLPGIPIQDQVAAALGQLEAHLYQWKAKYETWIPEHPEHALVYLGDEKQHGIAFPYALEGMVDRLIQKSSRRRGSAAQTT